VVALVRAAHPDLDPAQIKRLVEETAEDSPSGGRDDSFGYGFINPVAALEKGAEIKPAAAPAYPKKYFGQGPVKRHSDSGGSDWPGLAVGALGAGFLVVATLLWRTRRRA
jgi:hypothetical protein